MSSEQPEPKVEISLADFREIVKGAQESAVKTSYKAAAMLIDGFADELDKAKITSTSKEIGIGAELARAQIIAQARVMANGLRKLAEG